MRELIYLYSRYLDYVVEESLERGKPFMLKWRLYNVMTKDMGFLKEEISRLGWKTFCDISIYNFEELFGKHTIKMLEKKYPNRASKKYITFADIFDLFIRRDWEGLKPGPDQDSFTLLSGFFQNFGIQLIAQKNDLGYGVISNGFYKWQERMRTQGTKVFKDEPDINEETLSFPSRSAHLYMEAKKEQGLNKQILYSIKVNFLPDLNPFHHCFPNTADPDLKKHIYERASEAQMVMDLIISNVVRDILQEEGREKLGTISAYKCERLFKKHLKNYNPYIVKEVSRRIYGGVDKKSEAVVDKLPEE